MSPGELVRQWWDEGDHEALVAACDPAVVWDLTRLDGWSGEPGRRGPDGVRAVLRELEWGPGGTCIACGDTVLVNAHADGTSAVLHRFAGDRIVRLESITDPWDAQLELTGTDPVAVVRAVWTAWEARDMDRVLACFADDVVFDLSHYDAWRWEPRYDGVTSMMRFLAQWMSWWHGYNQQVLDDEPRPRRPAERAPQRRPRRRARRGDRRPGLRGPAGRQDRPLDGVPGARAGAGVDRATAGAR